MRRLALLLLLSASGAAFASDGATTTSAIAATSADEEVAIAQALRRGQAIYRYDQAAWHTTDALLEDLPTDDLNQVRGWVVVPVESGLRVYYYGGEPGARHAIYSADWLDAGSVANRRRLTTAEDRALPAEAVRLSALIDSVSLDGLQNCSDRRFNMVMLPASETGTTDSLYLLTPQTGPEVPFGGHHRIDFVDGREVSRRRFTNSCISIPGRGEMLVITHLLDPVPTEIHVFSMFAARKPVAVATTNGRVWAIEIARGRVTIEAVQQARQAS